MLQFLLVMALQPYNNMYGNPYHLYVQRNSIVTLTSHVGTVCKDPQYKECSRDVQELCAMSLTNHNEVVVEGSCTDIKERITKGLR